MAIGSLSQSDKDSVNRLILYSDMICLRKYLYVDEKIAERYYDILRNKMEVTKICTFPAFADLGEFNVNKLKLWFKLHNNLFKF